MKKATDQKSQSPGCLGAILMIAAPFLIGRLPGCTINHTGPMNAEDLALLDEQASQIRTHLMAGECDRLYQDFFRAIHTELSGEDFAKTCTQMQTEYQAVESTTLVSTRCETTRYPFKNEEYGNCATNYRVSLSNGTTVREVQEWYLENGEYQLVAFYWPEAQAEN